MIFVIFGNVPIAFPRLAAKIVEISARYPGTFVIQNGHTKCSFPHAQARDFVSSSEMEKYLKEAEIIVTHGGYGTLSEAMKKGKKIVAVPRLEGEHNHSQRELVEALEKEGCLLAVYDVADLEGKIKAAKEFSPKPIKTGNAARIINEFIRNEFPGLKIQ